MEPDIKDKIGEQNVVGEIAQSYRTRWTKRQHNSETTALQVISEGDECNNVSKMFLLTRHMNLWAKQKQRVETELVH